MHSREREWRSKPEYRESLTGIDIQSRGQILSAWAQARLLRVRPSTAPLHEPAPVATEEEPDGKIRFAIASTSIPGCTLLRSGRSHFPRRINA
jgi:hypothetical protein